METKEAIGTFEETAKYQEMYSRLLSVCDVEGTMISQYRLLERDPDIAPHRFFRRGTRVYVFPPQETSLAKEESKVIDPSAYELRTEKQTFTFDQSLVKGRIRIEYKDSENKPILKVADELGNSKLPETVRKTLDDLF